MAGDYAGRIVIVTGASSGLGRAIAAEVAGRGAEAVVINYATSREGAEETAKTVKGLGSQAVVVRGDVAKDEDCRRIVAAAAPFGRVNALFNNAGATVFAPEHADLDAVSADDFVRIYRVNVAGTFQMVRAARSLLEAGVDPGAVVNTSSIAAVTGIGTSVPYAASKGALNTLTLSLARALAPKIRVNAVCPGFIDTPWFSRASDQGQNMERLRQAVSATTPLRVASSPEDIAASAAFFGSPQSRHVTGETLLVDAGSHLGPASARVVRQDR